MARLALLLAMATAATCAITRPHASCTAAESTSIRTTDWQPRSGAPAASIVAGTRAIRTRAPSRLS